jgi:phosphatidylethanolamine/phosphatidyl-N-methylethanolamine N-methyltransferase
MANWLHDQRVFWRQFRRHFHTTGSLAPSSRYLGRALARFVGMSAGGQRILEVGPGTGAVTAQVVRRLRDGDRLDLVELNDEFVRHLEGRFANEHAFAQVAPRCRVLHQRLEDLQCDQPYDVVISGLPLNNFSAQAVDEILAALARLVRPGGTLSFFEYVAIRRARAAVSNRHERQRLQGIGHALAKVLVPYEVRRDYVWPNLPPACVHHLRWPEAADR